MARTRTRKPTTAANVGFEAQLWQMADALRGSMDAAEYKHVTLGLLFLKYISDAFEEHHAALLAEQGLGADPEDPDEYFSLAAESWLSRIATCQAEARTLAITRDSILPKLLSGVMSVPYNQRAEESA